MNSVYSVDRVWNAVDRVGNIVEGAGESVDRDRESVDRAGYILLWDAGRVL